MQQTTDKKEVDYNDYWYIKDNPLTKVGVFPYLGKNISEELEPNKVYYVLRPEEELSKEETVESFKLLPIIDDHVMLGTKQGMQPYHRIRNALRCRSLRLPHTSCFRGPLLTLKIRGSA